MSLINKLRKLVDQPVWEYMRFTRSNFTQGFTTYNFPTAATGSRYYQYNFHQIFQEMEMYDTFSDGWAQLGQNTTPYPSYPIGGGYDLTQGHYGNFISATSGSSTAIVPMIDEKDIVGLKIKVIEGLGIGQERTITACTTPEIVETFTFTAITNTVGTATTVGDRVLAITDTSKKWVINQWRGYLVKAILGTGTSYFVRRVLYNNNDTLFFANVNWHAGIDPHQAYNHLNDNNAITPTTGTQLIIQKNTITVDSPWTTNLDKSSKFEIKIGSIASIRVDASLPAFVLQRYEPMYGQWFPLHNMTNVLPPISTYKTIQLESIASELTPTFITGSLTSGSSRTAVDTTQNWNINQWRNYQFVNKTTGIENTIISNTSTTLQFASNLEKNPSGSNQYEILADSDKSYLAGCSAAGMVQYSNKNNSTFSSQRLDHGVVNVASVSYSGSSGLIIPIVSINRTGSIATVTTITGHPFEDGNVITITGATGSDASIYNGSFVVTGSYPLTASLTSTTSHPTNFKYTMGSTPSVGTAGLNVPTTTIIYDTTKNWETNEWVGKVYQQWNGSVGVGQTADSNNQFRRITSNTSQSLTLAAAIVLPTVSVFGYNILSDQAFGTSYGLDPSITGASSSFSITGSTINGSSLLFISESQFSTLSQIPLGCPITGSGIPSSAIFRNFQPANGGFITASLSAIATSTQNNIIISFETSASRGFGTATGGTTTTLIDTTKIWQTNFWVGSTVRLLTNANAGLEGTITSNTSNTLTFTNNSGGSITAIGSTDVYSIIPIGRRNGASGGHDLKWIYGRGSGSNLTPTSSLGKHIIHFEGGDTWKSYRYDIATSTFAPLFIANATGKAGAASTVAAGNTIGAGACISYDGKNRIYIQPYKGGTAQFVYVDTETDRLYNVTTMPAGNLASYGTQRMIIKTSEDGLDYLYYVSSGGTIHQRTLVFY